MRVIEYASGGPQVCGAPTAPSVAIMGHIVSPAILIATFPPALNSSHLRLASAERVPNSSLSVRQNTSARRSVQAANWLLDALVGPIKVFALSLVCAVIAPALAVVVFVLTNTN